MPTRRQFVKTLAAGTVTLPWLDLSAAPPGGAPATALAPNPIMQVLPGFEALPTLGKIRRIQRLMETGRAHPSGILLCMPKVTAEGLRQVRDSDFDGMDRFSDNFGLKFKSVTDFFDNENSIFSSGCHLAAQSLRYEVTGEPEALAGARRALASLRAIYELGVAQGRTGFLGKPYHFEFSSHTTGDQYNHALWGMWTFFPLASAAEQAEIRMMIRAMADEMMAADFTLHFSNGRHFNMREDTTDYNAIMAALVAAAYKLTGESKYRDSLQLVLRNARWMHERRLDRTIRLIKAGEWRVPPWEKFAGTHKRPDEFIHWEEIIHCQFTVCAATIIHESAPDILPAAELSRIASLWWEDCVTGFDREHWGYLYWFLVSAKDRSWHAFPATPRVPREEWYGGHPMLSYASHWIFGDALARFLWTAVVVARRCPEQREAAVTFCTETYRRLGPEHLLWIRDPDGKQIPPELRYFTEFMSSEVPEGVVASYWEGRRLKLWS